MRHAHDRNCGPIIFKITDKAQLTLLLFGIENQQDRSITSGRKSGPRSSHIAALVSEPDSEVTGSNPGGGKSFFFVILNVFSYEISKNRLNDWIYYNTLVFLFYLFLRLRFYFTPDMVNLDRLWGLMKPCSKRQNIKFLTLNVW